jgi:hypothetical protein
MAHQLTTSYVADSILLLQQFKSLADRAMAQVTDEQLAQALDPGTNSIAVIVKHIAGNLRSRWTDFLTTDGEKPDRDRDAEFEAPSATRAEMLSAWEHGWSCVFGTLRGLTDADLSRTVTIRGEPHSVTQAINRMIAHTASHIGQIVFLAKHLKGGEWQNLSIPRGGSRKFNERVASGEASQR